MKISLCITNYNRLAYLFKSFEQVLNDERIDEVVIVDDCSDINLYRSIEEITRYMPKVKLFRNENNLDVYANKREAISKAENEYCIIFDSDNVISTQYLDKIYSVEWNSKTILAPDFAEPVFDYTKYAGIVFTKQNIAQYAFKAGFDCLMNTMNYFVHKDSYLSVWQSNPYINGADSIYMNYLWLLAGNEIHCLSGLRYFHRVNGFVNSEHGSNFVKHAQGSTPVCKDIEKLISQMR